VGETFSRAQELCHQIGETPYLTPVMRGLHRFFLTRGDAQTAREIGEQLVTAVQAERDPALLTEAQRALGITLWFCGELEAAQVSLERGLAHYSSQRHAAYVLLYGQDPGVVCLSYSAWALWFAGYPDQALKRGQQAVSLAQELAHPYSLAQTLSHTQRPPWSFRPNMALPTGQWQVPCCEVGHWPTRGGNTSGLLR
jgi:tetratricopeptide (TPR) repeat protein